MGHLAVLGSRMALAVVVAGTLFFQGYLIPLLALDLSGGEDPTWTSLRLPWLAVVFLALLVLGAVTVEVVAVCVWRLLTMVRKGTVFSDAAFRHVDIIIVAIAVACLIAFGIACTLAPGDVAPEIVLLLCVAAAAVGGAALSVFVMRMLLAQAVARDQQAHQLQAELDEVI